MAADAAASSYSGRDEYSTDNDRFLSWWLVLALGAILLVLASVVYAHLGWQRMDAICSTAEAVPRGLYVGTEVTYSWSWRPFGYTCTWGDIAITKFWW